MEVTLSRAFSGEIKSAGTASPPPPPPHQNVLFLLENSMVTAGGEFSDPTENLVMPREQTVALPRISPFPEFKFRPVLPPKPKYPIK